MHGNNDDNVRSKRQLNVFVKINRCFTGLTTGKQQHVICMHLFITFTRNVCIEPFHMTYTTSIVRIIGRQHGKKLLLLPPLLFLVAIIMVQTGTKVGLAFGLTIAAGLSTCIGGFVIFFKRLVRLASPVTLAVSLSLSAGVMVFISLVEIYGESVENFKRGFQNTVEINKSTDCGQVGLEFINSTQEGQYCAKCDSTCEGHAWTAASATFLLGVLIIFVVDYIVTKISPDAHEELEISHLNELRDTVSETTSPDGSSSRESLESPPVDLDPKRDTTNAISMNSQLNRTGVLTAIAIGLHNIPEGVATYIAAIGDLSLIHI